MTIQRFISTLQHYGIKGVRDWFVRFFSNATEPLLVELQHHVKEDITPIPGITIVGDFGEKYSLTKVLKDFAQSLKEANFPFQTLDLAKPIPSDFILNRYSDIIGMFRDFPVDGIPQCRQHRIIFWEFDTGFARCHPELVDGSPLLVFSKYCYRSLRDQVHPSTKIQLLRYPFHFSAPSILPSDEIRAKYEIPQDAFMVFFNFDYRSSYYRKNPEGLLAAFLQAFKPTDNAVLVFKTMGSNVKREMADKLHNEIAKARAENQIVFIDNYISNDDLVSLTSACDVYASLHRGEGFGLGVAEAMSLGKAVVVSDCGATNEFCHPDTAIIIPHKIVAIKPEQIDHPDYAWVKKWPEPDINAAAIALRQLSDNPSYRQELGKRAKEFIADYYSLNNFKKSIDELLQSGN